MALAFESLEAFNRSVEDRANQTLGKLTQKLASYDLTTAADVLIKARSGRKPLQKSPKKFIKKEFGQAEIVRFSFFYHGWFFDRGVGRGTKVGSVGSGKRIPRPWIDIILEAEVEAMADEITEIYGDDVLDTVKILR